MATPIQPDDYPKTPEQQLNTDTNASAPHQPQKLKRFRFTSRYDLELLKSVRFVNVHLATWEETEALYDEVSGLFMKAVPATVFQYSQRPSGKTLADIFKRLVRKRRDDVKRTSVASRILEKYGEQEQLLDDLILQIDEKDEATRAEKEDQKDHEAWLAAAGKIFGRWLWFEKRTVRLGVMSRLFNFSYTAYAPLVASTMVLILALNLLH